MLKVSVIVPVYNVEQYLGKCIDSILRQTFQDFELILVDDGSTDRSSEICDHYAEQDQRILAIHKENGGLSSARNAGFKEAKGEYTLFVDSDDTIRNTLLDDTVLIAEREKADMVIFNFASVDCHGTVLADFPLNIPSDRVFNLSNCPDVLVASPTAWNKLYRRSFLLNTGLQFPEGVWYEDLRTTPKLLACADRIYYYNRVEYYYLYRTGSTMHNGNIKKIYCDRVAAIQDLIVYFRDKNLYQAYFSEIEAIATLQGYFYPCREILLIDPRSHCLEKFRSNIESLFPDFKKNHYLRQLTCKEKIIFNLLYHRQYWMVCLNSKVMKFLRKLRNE